MKLDTPYIINFKKIGSSMLGYISVAEFEDQVPFNIKRVYWTYYTPNDVERGFHAHKELFQVIVAVSGIIHFKLVDSFERETNYTLDAPSKGLFIPKMFWREISFSHDAVLLCLASDVFKEEDYIRDYKKFLEKNE